MVGTPAKAQEEGRHRNPCEGSLDDKHGAKPSSDQAEERREQGFSKAKADNNCRSENKAR